MSKVLVGIGIPGSGKSTALKRFAAANNYTYICPDDIRLELTGDPADQTKNKEVWELAHKRASEAIGEGKDIVFDATFTVGPQRQEFLAKLRGWGAGKIVGVYVDTELNVAMERNAGRERKVPEHVLGRMHAGLQADSPQLSDGFDSLFTLDKDQRMKEVSIHHRETELTKRFS